MSDPQVLLPLLVVVPILAATIPLLLGLRFDRVGWSVATVVSLGLFGMAIWLAVAVFGGEHRIVHGVGGFYGPIGIELVADRFSTSIVVLVTAITAAVLLVTRKAGPRGNAFAAGCLLLTGGLLGLTLTGDVFNMFVFLEITGLATYALVARGRGGEAALAALKYLILGTLGASLYLVGVGMLYVATGSLNMTDLSIQLAAVGYEDPLVRTGFVFIFVGFAIKVAQWPLHTWQPDAYQHAPDGITPLIAALVSTVSAYALGRLLFSVFGVSFLETTPWASEVILLVGATSVLAGSALAVMQWDVKRMLAYSSVSQFGLIVAAYGLVNETALLGAMIHLLGHGLLKGALFIAVAGLAAAAGARTIRDYGGIAKRHPYVSGGLAVLGIGLVGIPPSIGFLGKWYIAVGAVEARVWSVTVVIFLSTMLTLAYIARLGERMYFSASPGGSEGLAGHAVATDGGDEPPIGRVTIAIVVGIALVAVVLGFAGMEFQSAFEPFIEDVFAEVTHE